MGAWLPFSPVAERLLSGWGLATRSLAHVSRPSGAEEVASLIAGAGPRGILARGLGRAYGDAAQNAGGSVLEMTGLDGVRALDAASGEVTVAAGTSLEAVARAAIPRGWFPAVVPGTRFVTVGGAIAADVHGKNHHVDGGFGRYVRSFVLITPDAERRVVTRDGDRATFDATVGGMGLTGVVEEATLQLTRLPSAVVREEITAAQGLDELLELMSRGDDEHRYSVAWVDAAARGARLGRGLLLRGDHASGAEAAAASAALAAPRWRVPRWLPGGLLGLPTVTAFNALWLHAKPVVSRHALTPLASYFWPLDGVRGWNRLYGARGLLQYQCVVPFGAEDVLRAIFRRARAARVASPLVVLKRMGDGEGPLAFAMRGWTLALDFPAGARGLGALLDGFDSLVAAVGGRVYLAKDARLRPGALRAMYPRLDEWLSVRGGLDPRGVMRSDLARRLELA
jgi:decaprenylphospho-beta-D-ribofuranose 2-oxidase